MKDLIKFAKRNPKDYKKLEVKPMAVLTPYFIFSTERKA
jgi:hypothetical protein